MIFKQNKFGCDRVYPWAMRLLNKSTPEDIQLMALAGTPEREELKTEIMGFIVSQHQGFVTDHNQEVIADKCLAEFNQDKYLVGYLFDPSHGQVNYLKKGATGDLRRSYSHNFTTNPDHAEVVFDEAQATAEIIKLVSRLKPDPPYQWTPVIINIKENTRKILVTL